MLNNDFYMCFGWIRSASGGLRHKQDDDLQFLSLEERDCILFFEEIICSLEEDDERKDPHSYTTAPHHDIIDLVHATPDHSKPRDTLPVIPDFQELIIRPEMHCEAKAKRDVVVSQEHFRHLPSLESTRHGPPTHAKPSRLPDRISVLLGSKPRTRSISFRDPTPEKSRMEALSKLGLAQRRTQSVMHWKSAGDTLNITNPADHAVTHTDFNSFGGKSITFNHAPSDFHHNNFSSRSRVVNHEASIEEDASSSDRTSDEGLLQRTASRSEALVKPKPSFRAQGVTVQFSGRGASGEARRDALHKLGLMCSHAPN
ncbi:uncharacterized protein LOC127979508 [Carassius gibelio]|uniref:uncharacterized protein LOC127979508 n=1 Tax=Carassius gibelio TaxID=101364 RepID=UPI0022785649|nr:uncharacterized protein LOC127979508 [Carassius gibelio]